MKSKDSINAVANALHREACQGQPLTHCPFHKDEVFERRAEALMPAYERQLRRGRKAVRNAQRARINEIGKRSPAWPAR